jgi:tRNA(Ile)-lysidine synthase
MDALKSKTLNTIKKYQMILPDEKIVLAVSGGPDSTTLLYMMYELQDELKCSLHIAHLNHKLRGEESDADAEFVVEQASKLNIPVTVESQDVKKMITSKESIESGARRIRYDFYKRVISDTHANRLAQGHTADDQVETVIMRLLRGSGAHGLKGIPPTRDKYIRPLIEMSRKEVNDYLQNIGVNPRCDSSNLSTEYERNRIRHELIPLLENRFSPNIRIIIQQTADILRTDDDLLTRLAIQTAKECIKQIDSQTVIIHIPIFREQHLALQRRILRLAIESLLGDLLRYDFDHIRDLLDLVEYSSSGKSISLPRGIIAEKSYDKLILQVKEPKSEIIDYDYLIKSCGETNIPELRLSIVTEVGE